MMLGSFDGATDQAYPQSQPVVLMSADLADGLGKAPTERLRLPAGSVTSAISDLIVYLRREDARWLEQEELDPARPVL